MTALQSSQKSPAAAAQRRDVPLCVPELRGKEWEYVKQCLDTNYVSSVGPFVERFERQVADYLGAKHTVATVNGTAALHVALLAAGVEPDDEVLVSTLSFIAPANAVRYIGAWPVFIDAEPEYWQMDASKAVEFLEQECQWTGTELRNKRSGRRVRAILPVDILGHPADMDPLLEAATKYELAVIEDAAEGLGARYKGRTVGRLGDIACLSFNGNKVITTGGGGMIVTDNADWAERARYLTTQAKDDAAEYVHRAIGYNYRLTNLQAAMGCAQMECLSEYVAAKRRIAETYRESLAGVSGLVPMGEAAWAYSTYWMFTVLIDVARFGHDSRFILRELSRRGIQTRPLWQPLHISPAHAGAQAYYGDVAERLYEQALCLPCSVGLTEEDQRRVIQAIVKPGASRVTSHGHQPVRSCRTKAPLAEDGRSASRPLPLERPWESFPRSVVECNPRGSGLLDRIKAMRLAEEGTTVHASKAAKPRRILFNCQHAWEFGYVEYALATALRLRGHDVRMVVCGGLPEYCEQQTRSQARPSCEVCVQRMLRRFDAFDLPFTIMAEFISPGDVEYAKEISRDQAVAELRSLSESGVPVGQLAFYNLFQYFRGYPFEIAGEAETVFRRCVSSAVLITRAAERLIDEYRPDTLCTVNGKFLQWAPFVYAARQRGIPYCTWEDLRIRTAAVTFASNGIAHELPLDEVWQEELRRPFPEESRREIREHFRLWAKGSITPWPYYGDDAVNDPDEVRRRLGVRRDVPIVALFPNLCWDSTSVGFESAFASMYDWVASIVLYARRRPDIEFVIRAHPGESKLPVQYQSTTPVARFVRQRCAPVPPNVKLIEGDNPVTSYALGEISKVVMTYTSTLGIEFALAGIRPWTAARAPYGRKGFTTDLVSAQDMYDRLDRNQLDNRLTPEQIEFAERFAHMFRYRKIFSFPYLDDSGNFKPPSWRFFAPGGHNVIDRLCEAFLNHGSFLDINPPKR